jgi:membrane protease YdiL (CAAX protease family)
MLLALGEEVGWRGFLYPELNKSMGKIPTWLLGGFIWGAFHFPIMILAGYEYGTSYFGFPVVGMIVFCIFCIALGLISEIIYDKTKCIWYPSLLHGAVNACTFTAMFLNVSDVERVGKLQILGPFFNGVISGIPLLVLAIVFATITLKKNKAKTEA